MLCRCVALTWLWHAEQGCAPTAPGAHGLRPGRHTVVFRRRVAMPHPCPRHFPPWLHYDRAVRVHADLGRAAAHRAPPLRCASAFAAPCALQPLASGGHRHLALWRHSGRPLVPGTDLGQSTRRRPRALATSRHRPRAGRCVALGPHVNAPTHWCRADVTGLRALRLRAGGVCAPSQSPKKGPARKSLTGVGFRSTGVGAAQGELTRAWPWNRSRLLRATSRRASCGRSSGTLAGEASLCPRAAPAVVGPRPALAPVTRPPRDV